MKFISPARDPGFADSSIHGALAQREFLNRVFLYCKNFRTAIDVGAHIGLCTDILLGRFKKVVAFEPVWENFDCLQANIGNRAQLENVALGRRHGVGAMTLPPGGNSGMWHVREDADDGASIYALDSYNFSCVDLLKIDTEGFEGRVLEGALATIHGCRPVIVFEDNGLGAKYYGPEWVDPKPILSEFGYMRATRIRKDEVWVPC